MEGMNFVLFSHVEQYGILASPPFPPLSMLMEALRKCSNKSANLNHWKKNETKIRVSHPFSLYTDPHLDPAITQILLIRIRIYRFGMTHFQGKPIKSSSIFVSLWTVDNVVFFFWEKKSNNWKKLIFRMFSHTIFQNMREFSTPGSGYGGYISYVID